MTSTGSSGSGGPARQRVDLGAHRIRDWRPRGLRLRGLLRSLLTSYVALGVTLYILPGREAGPLAVLGLVLVAAAVGVVLRPLLAGLALVTGSLGLLLVGVLSQAIILDVAIAVAPDVHIHGDTQVLVVSWVAAAVAAVLNWLFDAGSEDAFLDQLLGRAVWVARRQTPPPGRPPGERCNLLILQFDGVGEDLLRQAIEAGDAPTLSGWLRDETHVLRGWHTGLPATTPAGQAVLLHGDVTEVPSFRWFEKETGRLMVVNHPRDAAAIQRRLSDGHGLLAGGGVSVSNLFSGDAPMRLLTMSDARLPSRRTQGLASFANSPSGLVRSLVVAIGQVLTELYQGSRQRRRDVRPRIKRGLTFAVQRAVTTALLRDLNIAIVAEQIARAAPAIYVDFVDYDEVAHHAGPSRPESMATVEGLDRLVHFFVDLIRETGQDYEIVIVSDHGQSQGATFAQLSGSTLPEVVAELTAGAGADSSASPPITADPSPAERWGTANLLLTGVARSGGIVARAVARARPGGIVVGPSADPVTDAEADADARALDAREVTVGGHFDGSAARTSGLVVASAGSLAHLYLPDVPGRVTREEIDRRYPRLVSGLAAHPHVGAVVVRSDALRAPIAVGARGWRVLNPDGAAGGEGDDPLADFGVRAAADLCGLDQRRHVGDLILLGRFDPHTGEVAAFEELVGSHGGLGGGQTGALLLHPTAWTVPGTQVLDGRDVHRVLCEHVPVRSQRQGA